MGDAETSPPKPGAPSNAAGALDGGETARLDLGGTSRESGPGDGARENEEKGGGGTDATPLHGMDAGKSSSPSMLRRRGKQSLDANATAVPEPTRDPLSEAGSASASGGKVFYAQSYAQTPKREPQKSSTWRIAAIFMLFAIASLVKLHRQSFLLGSFPALNPANYTRYAYEEPEKRKLPPGHFVWKENETWSGNLDSLFAPEPAPVEQAKTTDNEVAKEAIDPTRFCGECRWNQWGSPITCQTRASYLKDTYKISEEEARRSVMEKTECVRKEPAKDGPAKDGEQSQRRRVEESPNSGEQPKDARGKRGWDRMLFGIFSQDSPNEHEIRMFNRETHLRYYKHQNAPSGEKRPNYICSLHDLLSNATLAGDAESCRVVYTFVMGGGIGDMKLRAKLGGGRDSKPAGTRCLWEDEDCGGKDITKWTLDEPKCNVSDAFANELQAHDDITILSIPENHELGKTDTWFTYAAMLTRDRPDLQLGFVGKMDSDNFIRWPTFLSYLELQKEEIDTKPYIYGGYIIHKDVCSGRSYGFACKHPSVIFERFATGAHVYLSTPLAQHVFLNGTTLERKKEVWTVGEDMQLGNMVYSDPKIDLQMFNHRYGPNGRKPMDINTHCFNDAERCRREYYKVYPGLKDAGEEWKREQAKKGGSG